MPLNFPFNNFLNNVYNMAGNPRLSGFLQQESNPPHPPSPSPQPLQQRTDRQAMAQKLRVLPKKQRDASGNMNRAQNQDPVYEQPAEFSQGNTVPGTNQIQAEYNPEEEQENAEHFEDSTVNSAFDETISQGNFRGGQDIGVMPTGGNRGFDGGYHRGQQGELEQTDFHVAHQNGYDRASPEESVFGQNYIEDARAPLQSRKALHQPNGQGPQTQALGAPIYKQSQTPKPAIQSEILLQPQRPQHNSPSKPRTFDRFNHAITNRPKNGMQTIGGSRKRGLEEGVFSPKPKSGKAQVEVLENAVLPGNMQYRLPPLSPQDTQQGQSEGSSDGERYSEDSTHMDEQPALQSRPNFHAGNSQHQITHLNRADIPLDYDDAALRNMDYEQLKDESFEGPPALSEQPSEPDLSLSDRPINERVSHHVEQHRPSKQEEMDKQRATMVEFFGSLSKDDWEEAGDWFLSRFSDTLEALKKARKEKRAMVAKFEEEIEKRERDVRGCLRTYNQDMERMKRGARGVIEGNNV
ncbi:hypothetical protein BHYA_0074g00280 [Botrytis hyacinthi]|uniref:Extracellular mutant protein 11 C-terminal domain-containing protein n=1 Tax=Botrytis hyacinthi TaxID=278943 RepID=A0A4Z1GTE9_9HELO|nr:hypothetical protein BHYA_0074g00280 [Botrytis hyacinthi]